MGSFSWIVMTQPPGAAAAELADFHADAVDRSIAATAIAHGATLITADQIMLRRHAVGT